MVVEEERRVSLLSMLYRRSSSLLLTGWLVQVTSRGSSSLNPHNFLPGKVPRSSCLSSCSNLEAGEEPVCVVTLGGC